MLKRVLSLALCVVLACSLLPSAAIAEGDPTPIDTGILSVDDYAKNGDGNYDYVYYGGIKWRVLDTEHEVYTDDKCSSTATGMFLLSEYGFDGGTSWHSYDTGANPKDGTGYIASNIRAYLTGEGTYERFIVAPENEQARAKGSSENSKENKQAGTFANWLYDKNSVDTNAVSTPESNVKYYTGDDESGYNLFTGSKWEASTSYYTFTRHTTGSDANLTYYSGYSIGSKIVSGEEAAVNGYNFVSRYGITDAELNAAISVYQNPIEESEQYKIDGTRCVDQVYEDWYGDMLSGDKLYLLSAAETAEEYYGFAKVDALTTFLTKDGRTAATNANGKNISADWWLRSATGSDYAGIARTNTDIGKLRGVYAYNKTGTYSLRPAVNIDPSAVLFASDATAGAGKVSASVGNLVSLNAANSWKLTIIDSTMSVQMTSLQYSEGADLPYTLSYANATESGNDVYVSMIITDKSGNKLYGYEKLKEISSTTDKSGEINFELPSWYNEDSCDLKFFIEKVDDTAADGVQYMSDYCSAPVTLTLTPESSDEKEFRVLLIGNSFTDDAKEYLGRLIDSYPFLAEKEVVLGSLTHGGRTVGYYANCAKAESGVTGANVSAEINKDFKYSDDEFDISHFKHTNSQKGEAADPAENSLSYSEWNALKQIWKSNSTYDNIGDALEKEDWDAVVIQAYSPDFTASRTHLAENLTYLTKFIEKKCPSAEVGFYFHWDTHEETGQGSTELTKIWTKTQDAVKAAGIDFVVPIGTMIENLRSTYLDDLSYSPTSSTLTITCDVKGLQRDDRHLSRIVGRYAAGITMLDTLVGQLYPDQLANRGELTSITDHILPEIGELPSEYVDMLYDADDAARTNPYTLTDLSGDGYKYPTVDPAITAQTALTSARIDLKDMSSATNAEAALANMLASDTLRNEYGIKTAAQGLRLSVKSNSLAVDENSYNAVISVQYGYTFKEVTISGKYTAQSEPASCKVVAKMELDGEPCYYQNQDYYIFEVSGKAGEAIDFDTIKAAAIAQAKQLRGGAASYEAEIHEDYAPNGVCTTYGEHDSSVHYLYVNVKTACKLQVYKSYSNKSDEMLALDETVPYGTPLLTVLNENLTDLDEEGYTHTEWYNKDSPQWTFTENDLVTGWTNVLVKYTPNSYTVNFDANGGDGEMAAQDFDYDEVESLTANGFTKTGYKFVGWNTEEDGSGTGYADEAEAKNLTAEDQGVVTLYAQWSPIKYRVIFDANADGKTVTGTMEDQVFTYDVETALNENTFVCTDAKNGVPLYVFDGWNTKPDGSGDTYDDKADFTNYTQKHGAQITLYAQWKHVTKSLTYVSAQGTALEAADVDIFSEVTVAGAPTGYDATKYTFKGWRSNVAVGYEVMQSNDKFIMPATDITLTAVWEEIALTYTVTFNNDGAEQEVQTLTGVAENSFITLPDTLTKSGFTLKGWNDGTTTYAAGSTYKVTGDVTFTAEFVAIPVPETYTVTFDTNGAAESVSNLTGIISGTCITLPAGLTSENCTFDGWTIKESEDNKVYAAGSTYQVDGSVTFVAKFTRIPEPKTCTVIFNTKDAEQTVPAFRTVVENTEIILPGNLTKANSVFKGWKLNDTDTVYAAGVSYVVKANTAFTAVFETAVTYDVTFNTNGATQTVADMKNVAAGSYITLPTGLTRQNATFLGWECGETLYAAGSPYQVNSAVTFTAKFEDAKTYTVTYKDGDWTSEESKSYRAGDWVTVENPTSAPEGFTFGGWESNTGETYQPEKQFKMPDTNVVLTAKWVADTYTITWKNGNDILSKTTVKYGETPEYIGETPTKDATAEFTYTFSGWTTEPVAATGDTTYEAAFTEAKRSYTVKFYNADGTLLESKQVEYGVVPKLGRTPTLEGNNQYSYTFKAWSPKLTAVTGDAEYTAVYDRTENTYTVTWVIEGVSTTETYTYNEMPTYKGDTPAKAETDSDVYEFAGWSPALSLVTRDVTYTAQFRTIGKYTVSYDLAGGESAKPDDAKYAVGSVVTAADVPTRTGYVFEGWLISYESKTVNANGTFTMPATDVTLTAQWTPAVQVGGAYIVAADPKHAVHEAAYSDKLTARKADATGAEITSGVKFILVDNDGRALGTTDLGHDLMLNANGTITGTAMGAGSLTFNVRLANLDNKFVSESRTITLVIEKAPRTCTVSIKNWTYGDEPNEPVVTLSKTEEPEIITVYYKVKDADDSTYTTEVPVNAGYYAVKAVVGESTNYLGCEGAINFEILKKEIASVTLSVTAPVACEAAQATIVDGDGFTGTITWTPTPVDGKFDYATKYTATVVLTPDSNHCFAEKTAAEGWNVSYDATSGKLTLTNEFEQTELGTIETPVIRPNGGRFTNSQTVSITCATDGAVIYYTTDGSDPAKSDTKSVYSIPFSLTSTTTVNAVALKEKYLDSEVVSATFTRYTPRDSSGGGGGGVSTYAITVKDSKNGTVTADRKTASSNAIVTLTVTPEQGWTLETLTATNASGKEIDLNIVKVGEKYTFKMPTSNVTVTASFMTSTGNPQTGVFVDVPEGSYCEEAVNWAVEKGVTNGVGDNMFAPNASCTRAQIVTFLWRAAGSPEPKSTASFTDVPANAYYAEAVAWAVEEGIAFGTGNGKFSPDATCTRAQAVTFLYRASGSPAVSGSAEFSDVAANAYYAKAVAWAEKNGITTGIGGGLFGSDNDCTRGQIVTFLWRAMAD